MLAHGVCEVSGSLGATQPVFGVVIMCPNEWVCVLVQKAWWSGAKSIVLLHAKGTGWPQECGHWWATGARLQACSPDWPGAGPPGAGMYLKVRIHPWDRGTWDTHPGWRVGLGDELVIFGPKPRTVNICHFLSN